MLIMDSREKNVKRIKELEKLLPEEEFITRCLTAGDALVSNKLIEITTIEDFDGKLDSNRLHVQIKKLEDARDRLKEEDGIDINICWLLEGTKWYYMKKNKKVWINKNRVYSALTDMSVDKDIKIILKTSAKKTAKYLAILSNRVNGDVEQIYQSLRNKKGIGKKSLDEQAEFVLEGLVDCGIKTAKALLNEAKDYRCKFSSGSLGRVLQMIIDHGCYFTPDDIGDYLGDSAIYKGALKVKNDRLFNHEYQGGK